MYWDEVFARIAFPVNSRLRDIPQSHRLSLKSFITELKLLLVSSLYYYKHRNALSLILSVLFCYITTVSPLLFIATVIITITIATITIISVIAAKLLLLLLCTVTVTNYHRYTYVAAIRACFRLPCANTIFTFSTIWNGAIRTLVIVKYQYKSQSSLG